MPVDYGLLTSVATGVLWVVSMFGLLYAYRDRHRPEGHYMLIVWLALVSMAVTTFIGRLGHAFVEPRSSITMWLFVGWTFSTIYVTTLVVYTIKRYRSKERDA